jgi:hypothetical protein
MDLRPEITALVPLAPRTGVTMTPDSAAPPEAQSPVTNSRPPTAAQKSAATVARHKDERRAESLQRISEQTADGSLVIRHMTTEQHDAASEVARQTRTRNDARVRRYRAPDTPAA